MLSFEDEFATALPRRRPPTLPEAGRARSPGILAHAMTTAHPNPVRGPDGAAEKTAGFGWPSGAVGGSSLRPHPPAAPTSASAPSARYRCALIVPLCSKTKEEASGGAVDTGVKLG